MSKISEDMMRQMMFELLHMERKNLRSRAKTEQRMSEEIQKMIIEYSKMNRES